MIAMSTFSLYYKVAYKQEVKKNLIQIPGVAISSVTDIWTIGIHSTNDLKKKNPYLLYDWSTKLQVEF